MGGWMCKWSMDCGSVGRWTDGLWDSEIWGLFAFVGLHQSTTQRLKSPRLWRFRIKFTSPFVLSSFILNPRCHSPATQSCQNLPVSRSLKAGRLYFVKQDTAEWGKACVDDASKNGSSSCIKECQEAMSLSGYTPNTVQDSQTQATKTQCVNTQVHLRRLRHCLAETRVHTTKPDTRAPLCPWY